MLEHGGMVETSMRTRGGNRLAVVALAALVLAVVAVVGLIRWNDHRADQERVDGYYCTLEGVSPGDPRCD
jgi:hypothetical protein